MNRSLRAALSFAATLVAGASLTLGAAHGAPLLPRLHLPKLIPSTAARAAPPAALKPGQWPQAVSDVAPDPDIRFGVLPNGMRYALRRQTTPAGQAALRLRFDAGSLMETDAQQGLAHFLEHMAFNGSRSVPEGEMIKILERLGLAFGADTNASTNFEETIYKLDLPRTDEETLDSSLMLLREAAGELLIDPAAVDRERGVVLSEERARDTPAYRVYKARLDFLLRGQRPPLRLPIGKVEVLKTAPADQLRAFYQQYYRPERTVLVAAGDFDLDAMEARIRDRFSGWTATGPAGTLPDLGVVARRKPEARLVVEAGAPPSLQLAWVGPPQTAPDTLAKRRDDLVRGLGFAVLNRRFSALGRAAEPPFLGAGAFQGDEYKAAHVVMITVNVQQDRWRQALEAVEREQRRVVQHGVRQDELDREIEELRAGLRAAVAGAATRRPAALAGEIVGSLSDDDVVTSPAQDLAFFEETVKDLKSQQVSQALKAAFSDDGPLVFMTSPRPVAGGEAAVLAALDASRKVSVLPQAAPGQIVWPYDSFGQPGKAVEEREIADMDTVFMRFENGVRLTIKPTRFRDDEVLVRVNVGRGLRDLPPDRQSPAWAASAFIEGGTTRISAEDMERVLASKVYGARFAIGDESFSLSGSTRTDNLDVQLQVLAAYVAEPGWRPEAFQRVKTAGATIHDQYEATASGVLSRDLPGLLHGDDRRWTFPTRADIKDARLGDLTSQVAGALAGGQIEVVVVGDITVEKAAEAVARTFGALPPRPAVAETAAPATRFPAPVTTPASRSHKGRKDQAVGYVAWRTGDFYSNPQQARDNAVMGEVLGLRLIDELREAQGATYSPSVNYNHSYTWPGWGYVSASVEVPPEKLPGFFADVRKIARDLAETEVSADELARAKTPRVDRIEKARKTNEYWISELSGAQADPRRLEAIRALIPGTERVTPADVREAARRVLADDRAWMMVVSPAS
jgi:zinc protease